VCQRDRALDHLHEAVGVIEVVHPVDVTQRTSAASLPAVTRSDSGTAR
jgi:hypothetical protein